MILYILPVNSDELRRLKERESRLRNPTPPPLPQTRANNVLPEGESWEDYEVQRPGSILNLLSFTLSLCLSTSIELLFSDTFAVSLLNI